MVLRVCLVDHTYIVRKKRLAFRLKYQKRIDISGEISKFRAKCQSQFDNSRKRKGILRKRFIGVFTLF